MAVADLNYVKITGRFGLVVADGSDADTFPDHVFPDTGTVTFTPNAPSPIQFNSTEGPLLIGMSKVTATIDSQGRLSQNGTPGVWLLDPSSPNLSVRNWTYKVEFSDIKSGSTSVTIPAQTFMPASGSETDLATLVPVATTPGVTYPAVTGIIFEGVKYTGDVDLDELDLGSGGGAVESVNGQAGLVVLDADDVGAKPASYVPAWGEVTGKPATFAPTIGATATTAVAGNDARLTNARTPTAHTHPSSAITDFSAAVTAIAESTLAALVDGAPGTMDTLNELAAALADDPNFATTMTTALAGKAPLSHAHTIANVTGLQAALDAKAASSHTHTAANVSDFAAATNTRLAAWGLKPTINYDPSTGWPTRSSNAVVAAGYAGPVIWNSVVTVAGVVITATAPAPTGAAQGDTWVRPKPTV